MFPAAWGQKWPMFCSRVLQKFCCPSMEMGNKEDGLTVFLPGESGSRIWPTDIKCTHRRALGYMHTCTHACMGTYICTHAHIWTCTNTHTCTHVHKSTGIHTGTEREMMRKVTTTCYDTLKWKDFVVYLILNSIRIHYFLYLIIMVLVVSILKNEANNVLNPIDEW